MAEKKKLAAERALPLRMDLTDKWEEMMHIFLSKITTKGELGTLANLELHNLRKLNYLYGHDPYLEELGIVLPDEAYLPMEYAGETRLIVSGCPSILAKGEDAYLRLRVLSASRVISGELMWRALGNGKYSALKLEQIARNVFHVRIPADLITGDFEYFISVNAGAEEIQYPLTARSINHTVVILN